MTRSERKLIPKSTRPAQDGSDTVVRPASADDSASIAGLYRLVYGEGGNGIPAYPYPQMLLDDAVRNYIQSGRCVWFVAECHNKLVGSFAAVANIGTVSDRVSEMFGLVVDPQWRRGGIGSELFHAVFGRLVEDGAQVILSETRTAEPGGWRTVRRAGFIPIGFEPIGHRMPQGPEAMLVLAWVASRVLGERAQNSRLTRRSMLIGDVVLSVAAESAAQGSPPELVELGAPIPLSRLGEAEQTYRLERDDDAATHFRNSLSSQFAQAGGIVGFARLQGEDFTTGRHEQPAYVLRSDEAVLAAVATSRDHLDQRLRILGIIGLTEAWSVEALVALLARFDTEFSSSWPITVIDVRADSYALQRLLEGHGFFPTSYYPGLVSDKEGRVDAIQYTRMDMFKLNGIPSDIEQWPQAANLAQTVLAGSRANQEGLSV